MARRGKGEGTVYRRADGLWVAQLDGGYRNGRRVRPSFYGRTRREVQDKLRAALAQADPAAAYTGRQTLEQFLTHWLERSAKPTVKPRTYEFYSDKVRLYILPALGQRALTRLSPQQVQGLYGELLNRGLSPRTVHHVHAVLRRALGQAERWGLVRRNPVSQVEPPKVSQVEMRHLDVEQAQRLLETAQHDRWYALWVLLLSTGLRIGEALGLSWGALDMEGSTLTVQQALQRQREAGLVLAPPKTRRSRRLVYLSEFAVSVLREHRQRQWLERVAAGSRWQSNDLVFCWGIGTPLEPSRANREFKAALARAGLPRLRLHDLRHTTVALLLAQGVHEKLIQEMLGHGSITMTLDTYGHVLPGLHRTAALAMDAIFGPRSAIGSS